jgi:hypothetical protein
MVVLAWWLVVAVFYLNSRSGIKQLNGRAVRHMWQATAPAKSKLGGGFEGATSLAKPSALVL